MEEIRTLSTQNTGLALALIMGGAKLLHGKPIDHGYKSSMLKEKYGVKTFQEGQKKALELCRKGIFGIITYNIVLDGNIGDHQRVYDEEMKSLDAGAGQTSVELEPAECVKLAAAFQHFRSEMTNRIRKQSIPFVILDTDDDRVIAASATASEATLRGLKII